MSFRLRLHLLHAGLLVVALGSMIVAVLLDAGPRVGAEYESIMQLAKRHVERSAQNLPARAEPEQALRDLLADLDHLRHVRIAWRPDNNGDRTRIDEGPLPARAAPGWISAALPAPANPQRIRIDIPGGPRGDVVVSAAPGDEIDEIRQTVSAIALRGLALMLALLGLSSLLIHGALKPLASVGSALDRLGSGNLDTRVAEAGPPELASICRALNTLAEALQQAQARNKQLAREMIDVRDRERRELARELHDELGPCLFTARANGAALVSAIDQSQSTPSRIDTPRLLQNATAVLTQIERIQGVNRRVLTRLSPPGLNELGLETSLRALADTWSEQHNGLRIDLDIALIDANLAEAEVLTIYRIVQEGLTNALRHGGAESVSIEVKQMQENHDLDVRPSEIVVRVVDRGSGVAPQAEPGLGIKGMLERVWALGGTLSLENGDNGGARLEARFPIAPASNAPREDSAARA